MKKILVFIINMFFLVLMGCENNLDKFSLEEYEKYITSEEYMYSNVKYKRRIENKDDAKIVAYNIWNELYDNGAKPYIVKRDKNNAAWLVHSKHKENVLGGVSWIILDDEGNVLAVWSEK